jgi:hypothetical protein
MAIKCQHKQHEQQDDQSKAKKSLIDEEKPKEHLISKLRRKVL